jgi:hypothetical protein
MSWLKVVPALVLAVGCGPKAPPVAAGAAGALEGSTWHIMVPDGDPADSWVNLLGDGLLEYAYEAEGSYTNDGTDHWRFDGTTLTIEWSNGYSLETYAWVEGQPVLPGTKTSDSWPGEVRSCSIERVR